MPSTSTWPSKEFASTTQRELTLLSAEVRRILTRRQSELVSRTFGKDAQILDSPGLDFALGQMEWASAAGHRGLTPAERAMSVAVRLELMPTGRLEAPGGPPLFMNGFLKLGQHADVNLRRDQIRQIQLVELGFLQGMSPFSRDLKAKLDAGLITLEKVEKEFTDFYETAIKKALPELLKLLDERQLVAMKKLALQRQRIQQGVLGVLLNDEAFEISPAQREEILKLVRGKTETYERLCSECEMQIWEQIPPALEPPHRAVWKKFFGIEQFKLLPGSPTLLLQGLEEDEKPAAPASP